MDFQIIASIVFVLFLILFLYVNRKKIKLQKIAFPLIYAFTYHAAWGIKAMDRLAKKYPRTIKVFGYCGIVVGFIGLPAISALIIKNFIDFLTVKETVAGIQMVLPIPVDGIFYVPFFYWIISITILAIVHEFSHGLLARVWNLRVKSTGIGFFSLLVPLIPIAFVEPDEKQIKKASLRKQLSVYAAGPFSNILLGFVVLGIILLIAPVFIGSVYEQDGIAVMGFERYNNLAYPAEQSGMVIGDRILFIDGVSTLEDESFTAYMASKKPGERIYVTTNASEYELILAKNPKNETRGYMGITVMQSQKIKPLMKERYGFLLPSVLWLFGLLYILYIFNIGIGLINLFPIYITDGARMLLAIVETKFKNKKKAMYIYSLVNKLFLFILLILVFFPLFKNLLNFILGIIM